MFRNVLVTIKKYPKSTAVFTGVSVFIGKHYYGKYENNLLRRKLCNKIKELGFKKIPADNKLFRVTIFLNPFAYSRSLLESFDLNAMPLFQISGLDVQMIYLDDDDQAKSLSNVLDPDSTDAVVVAGDDNLIAKTVTGLLRREDFTTSNVWNIPVYALPLGVFNNFCNIFTQDINIVNWCYRMIEPVLAGASSRRNALQIKPLDVPVTSAAAGSKSVFALTGVEWSTWRDAEYGGGGLSLTAARPASHKQRLVASKDWIYSPRQWFNRLGAGCRHAWTWLRAPSLEASMPLPTETTRTAATTGKKPKPLSSAKIPLAATRQASWLGRFFGYNSYSASPCPNGANSATDAKGAAKQPMESPVHDNPECGVETTLEISQASRIVVALDGDNLRLNVTPVASGLVEHVKQMLGFLLSPAYFSTAPVGSLPPAALGTELPENLQVGEFGDFSVLCSSAKFYPRRIDGEYFWIDNDSFEACPVEISILRDAISTFPPPETFRAAEVPV